MDTVLRTPGLRWIETLLAKLRAAPKISDNGPDDARARRAFVQDTINANPDAFASEHDVACMMYMYPGRF